MTEPSAFAGNAAEAGGRLSLARLTLTDFRSYPHLRLETDARPVVLTGANGAGKTNLLEAVSFLVPGRGLRGARLADLGRRAPGSTEEKPWAVAGRVNGPLGPVDLGTGRSPEAGRERRQVHIDGEAAKSQAALAEAFAVQWLTPQMDRLFQEGASSRRRFLDRLVFGADPAHAGRVSAYEQAMRERLRLLRDGTRDTAWLAALEDTMATRGVAVAAARLEVTERLAAHCAQAEGPFPRAGLRIEGTVESWLGEGPALEAEERLKAALAAARIKDAESGTTTVGPQRSDLEVTHLAKGQPAALCSTGEQKALLIAIVLANARMRTADAGAVPVLLLDEVAAHLDSMRREALYDEIDSLGAQAWMTGTDAQTFSSLKGRAQFFTVEDAAVTATD